MASTTPNFPKLNNRNYATWKDQMVAWGQKQGWWRIISGEIEKPSCSNVDAYQKWLEQVDKGAREIYLAIEDEQKHHLGGILDDPKVMWKLLEQGNQSKKPGTRFNAYNDLFLVRKQENEGLEDLITRIAEKVRTIKDLHPQDLHPQDFTLDNLDDKLHSMALI